MSNSDGLCAECTSDKYLVDKIQTTGSRLACVGCGQKGRKCIPIKELAADVREVLEKHFHRCESIEEGDSLNWVVQEIASVEPEIADRILEDALPSKGERIAAVKDGEDLFLEDGATYVERPAFDQEFRYHWESFCFNVKALSAVLQHHSGIPTPRAARRDREVQDSRRKTLYTPNRPRRTRSQTAPSKHGSHLSADREDPR